MCVAVRMLSGIFFSALLVGCVGLLSAAVSVRQGFAGNALLPADCAIVFGAAVAAGDRPSAAMFRRIDTAVSLYEEGSVERLILAGGTGEGNVRSEASVMREYAVSHGVHENDIRLEDASTSTLENLQYAQNLTNDCSSILGISDAYHLARIELLAERLGYEHFRTYPAIQRPPHQSELRSIFRETAAYTFYAFHADAIFALRNAVRE